MSGEDGDFQFDEERNLGVFTCSKVWDEAKPILRVSHDGDGDWQFLCGGLHDEESGDEIRFVCLEHLVERDSTLNQVADLCRHWSAERTTADAEWERVDGIEEIVRRNIEEFGLHVMSVYGDDDAGGFSYSIGMWKTFGMPELLCLGLPRKSAHGIINHVADLVRQGAKLTDGEDREDVLNGYPCRFRELARRHYRDYLGYANWYYEGERFPVLQLVYPDREGRWPGDEGTSEIFNRDQPVLWE